jgi:hypothetical protein
MIAVNIMKHVRNWENKIMSDTDFILLVTSTANMVNLKWRASPRIAVKITNPIFIVKISHGF